MINEHMLNDTIGLEEPVTNHSLSVVLPTYNEEQVIADTLLRVLNVLNWWHMDFEILVVNDGSVDQTAAVVTQLAEQHPQIRLITHPSNRGYGAALVSGFEAATKELTFFMDSDGQFDISDLDDFLSLIDTYDAVIGYRIDRQDSLVRKLNAWGWKSVVGLVLDVHVRDIDCAFKLFHTSFFHDHPLETRGAMINAEILYRLTHSGNTFCERGVQHFSRRAGRATGARPSVILRAFRELLVYSRKWHQQPSAATTKHELPMHSSV